MKHSTTVTDYLIRIELLIAGVTLNDASAAFDGMEAVLAEVKRRDFLPFSSEESEAADELEEEIEDAVMEIGYLIDAGMADDGNEDAVMDAMEGRIILQACDAVERFRAATAA
jgi:hypothetical protein